MYDSSGSMIHNELYQKSISWLLLVAVQYTITYLYSKTQVIWTDLITYLKLSCDNISDIQKLSDYFISHESVI